MNKESADVHQFGENCKRKYVSPQLVNYGKLRDLTQSGTGKNSESKAGGSGCIPDPLAKPCGSDRIIKENICRVGEHPLGFGLYLYDYKSEYRDTWGHGRQFGVMADEVETVMPEAVHMHTDGYKMVDYGMLGINRAIS